MEDLTLRPLGPAVTGGTIRREHRLSGCSIGGLWLVQRPHCSEDKQGLRVESVTAPLCDAVVVDGRVGQRRIALGETLPGIEIIAGEPAAALDSA
jgi:hypothetical protein